MLEEAEKDKKRLKQEVRKPKLETLATTERQLANISQPIPSDWGTLRTFAAKNNVSAGANPTQQKTLAAIAAEKARLEKLRQDLIDELAQIGEGANIPAEGISDLDINKAMTDHRQFLGAIAADEIHALKPGNQKRICWIQNTEPRAQGGAHWVAFFIDARPHGTMSVEYYDPLGDPITPNFLTDIKIMIKQVHGVDSYLKFRENKIADQSNTSNNCGPFSIRFL